MFVLPYIITDDWGPEGEKSRKIFAQGTFNALTACLSGCEIGYLATVTEEAIEDFLTTER